MTGAERLRQEGIEKGMELGEIKNIKKSIQSVLFSRFNISNVEINKALNKINDLILLENLFNKALQVESSDEFKNILNNINKQ